MAKKLQRSLARPRAQAPAGGATGPSPKPTGRRVPGSAVTEFTLQLATLIRAGIPVVRALKVLEGQTPAGPLRQVLGEVVEDVSAGTPLSEAMAKHGRAFDTLYSSMIRAGESGGVLDLVLTRVAAFRARAAELRAKVTGAMIYPMVVLVVSLVVIAVVVTWIIPQFQEVFRSFGANLPTVTRVLLSISDFAVAYWYAVAGVPVLVVVAHLVAMGRGGGYRRRVHGMLLRLPLLGTVLNQAAVSSFARTFGTLIQAGVPHVDALAITRDATANAAMAEAVEEVRRVVREGEGIARPMSESPLFENMVVSMVEVGEQTGELDRMLLEVAESYDSSVARRIDAFFKILEPALLVIIAVFVGFVVVALFLPLIELMKSIG